jgi:hypothetical protein|tara:strand:- start:66 stop:263 length:198 start_codon:yes stop_codon:yes gene_type:complete
MKQVPIERAKSYINWLGIGQCIGILISGILGIPITSFGLLINTLVLDFFWWLLEDFNNTHPDNFV